MLFSNVVEGVRGDIVLLDGLVQRACSVTLNWRCQLTGDHCDSLRLKKGVWGRRRPIRARDKVQEFRELVHPFSFAPFREHVMGKMMYVVFLPFV